MKKKAIAWSTRALLRAAPPRTVAVTVSIQSTLSEVAKISGRTVGDTTIYIDELRRAFFGAMTHLLGDGFQFARR